MRKITILFIPVAILLLVSYVFNPQQSAVVVKNEKHIIQQPLSQRKALVKGKLAQDSPNEFAKYHNQIRTAFNEDKPSYPDNYKFKELQKALANAPLRKKSDFTWVSRGPGNIGGRSRGVIIDPDDASAETWYVAAVGGGVWKTNDAGNTWNELTKGIGSLSASYMAMAPSNHNIIYLGTGEGFGNFDALGGQGLWKSTDRGQSWNQLANTATKQFGTINRIIVDPQNPDILLIVTSNSYDFQKSGVFKSLDGGVSWTKKFQTSSKVQQIVHEPGNFQIQYFTADSGDIYKSVDAGETWTIKTGAINNLAGRIEMCVSPVNTSKLFASVHLNDNNSSSEVYISEDKGESWKLLNNSTDFLGGQGWYDNAIIADPYEENVFYVAGVAMYKVKLTKVAGIYNSTITTLVDNYGGVDKGTHVDSHDFALMKLDDGAKKFRLLSTNDGGVCYTDDKGATFIQPVSGFVTSQFYGVDKQNGADRYIGGMQDNSSYVSPANSGSNDNWKGLLGGDGFDAVWHYEDPEKFMVSAQYNYIVVSHTGIDSNDGWLVYNDGGVANSSFYTRLAQSKQFPDLVIANGKSGLWKTEDFGNNWSNIKMPNGYDGTSNSTFVTISLANPNIIYAGASLDSKYPLFLSKDRGETWTTLPENPAGNSYFSGFASDPVDEATAFALFSSAESPKILKTSDYGQTWTDLSGYSNGRSTNGFPDVAVYDLLVMPYNRDILWAGTEIGLFESTDGGQSWNYANNGLPPVSVFKMRIVNDEVVIGSHGRGVWTASLPELAGYQPVEVDLPPRIETDIEYNNGEQYASLITIARSSYDSIMVSVNGVLKEKITSVNRFDENSFLLPLEGGLNTISIEVKKGEYHDTVKSQIEALKLKAPAESYATNFDNLSVLGEEFTNNGFYLVNESGFTSRSMSTSRPYPDNKTLDIVLNTPIVVSSENSLMKFKEIAIVEPGETGTVYPDEEFWDYVVVEASTNLKDWKMLVVPYDARYNTKWYSLYQSSTNPTSDSYVEREIDLRNHFEAGETVFIRFRLFSDQASNAWGWMIDDLYIQTSSLSLSDKTLVDLNVYPNPVNNNTLINLPEEFNHEKINYSLINIMGQTIFEGSLKSNNSTFKLPFSTDELNNGTYILKLENNDYISYVKLLKGN